MSSCLKSISMVCGKLVVASLTSHLLSILSILTSNGAAAEPEGLLSLCSHCRLSQGDELEEGGELFWYAVEMG